MYTSFQGTLDGGPDIYKFEAYIPFYSSQISTLPMGCSKLLIASEAQDNEIFNKITAKFLAFVFFL